MAQIDKKLLVINAVGLSEALISDKTPNLQALQKKFSRHLEPPIPAVTCTSQATLLTGTAPQEHGIVANGWYFKDLAQVWLWRQTNQLVKGEKIWETLKKEDSNFTCAKIFWWYNMYSTADFSATPRPIYRADGSKYPGSYTYPASFNDELEAKLGTFPLFKFWGPMTSIESSTWIADACIYNIEKEQPNLSLVYLPHLDYNLQRLGPSDPVIEKDMIELDVEIGKLLATAKKFNYSVMVLSEYGIQETDTPIHINRELRKKDWVKVRIECGEEHFDAGASDAFAVADHQIAHVYVKDQDKIEDVRKVLEGLNGIDEILVGAERAKHGLDCDRSGDIICISKPNAWFTYYFWLDDSKAPDYARNVDIHNKPGYDPVELFLCKGGKFKAAAALLKKKIGMRYNMGVIPLDATLVKGSHGAQCPDDQHGPVLLCDFELPIETQKLHMRDWKNLVENWFLN